MLNRLLFVAAIVGLAICVYLVARPSAVQTVRLEPSVQLPSQLDTPQPAPNLVVKPAPSVKPRPTQTIEPRPQQQVPSSIAQSASRPAQTANKPATSTNIAPRTAQNFQDFDAPATQAPTKILAPKADGSVWRLQVGAFRSAENARALQQKLLDQGLSVKIVRGEDGISRVLVGDYPTRDAAQADNKAVSSRVP
ncbi:MAG: SPOR domain-containing protein [Deinococcales bacterium]